MTTMRAVFETTRERLTDAWGHWWAGQFDYMGRTTRERYVLVAGPLVLALTLSTYLSVRYDLMDDEAISLISALLASSALGLTVRRMRDAGIGLFLAPLACIPGIGLLFVLVLGELPSRADRTEA